MSFPPEDPEERTSTLSPVSPKPMQVPAPSNIALLENQMDPNFDGGELDQQQASHNPVDRPQTGAQSSMATHQGAKVENAPSQASEAGHDPTPLVPATDNQSNSISTQNLANQSLEEPDVLSIIDSSNPLGPSNATAQAESFPFFAVPDTSTDPSNVNAFTSSAGQPNGHNQPEPLPSQPHAFNDAPTSSMPTSIDIQALLDNLNAPSKASTAPTADAITATASQPADTGASETLLHPDKPTAAISSNGALPPAAPNASSLPPRPPSQTVPDESAVQEQLDSNKQNSIAVSENPHSSAESSFAPLAHAAPPPLPTAGAPGVLNASTSALPPPPLPSFQSSQSASFPASVPTVQNFAATSFGQLGAVVSRPGEDVIGILDGENDPWDRNTQRKYDDFLADERRYVLEGQWDKFPIGSRLFLGNLPSEKVTKRDLFHVFHKHGKLAQISIKQAYGFVQYLDAAHCARAMAIEQGVSIRGKAIHLEVSVPGGKKRHQQNEGRSSRNRRSRSPQGSRNSGRNSRSDNQHRARSPNRSRGDHFDNRNPRSPHGYHSNPPRAGASDDGHLPLPYRQPGQIPDVQVIAREPLETPFIQYIEGSFKQRGINTDVLFLGAGLDESLVMRRQIIEGVLGVMRVDRLGQTMQRFQLTVFDRSAGNNNVKFDEYQNIEMHIVVELVMRAKQSARPSNAPPQYGYHSTPITPVTPQQPGSYSATSQPSMPPSFPNPPPPPQNPQPPVPSPSSIPNMDNQSLQNLLQTLSKQPQGSVATSQGRAPQLTQPPQTQTGQGNTPDINQILKAIQGGNAQQQPGQQAPITPLQSDIQLQQPQQGGTPTVADISQIMAQLNRYGR